jgi:hypothetical protein
MNKFIEISASEAADFEAFLDQCLAEMARANEQMKKDQAEIERLKAKTQATMESIKAILYAQKTV